MFRFSLLELKGGSFSFLYGIFCNSAPKEKIVQHFLHFLTHETKQKKNYFFLNNCNNSVLQQKTFLRRISC